MKKESIDSRNFGKVKPMFDLRSISKSFGSLKALDQLDLQLKPKIITGLIGPNGSGKTTLINIMTGIYAPDSGSIYFHQQNLTGESAECFAQKGIARTFQNIRLFKRMTVMENIMASLVTKEKNKRNNLFSNPFTRNKFSLNKAHEVLEIMNLKDQRNLFAEELPLPLRRKLEIARALVAEPEVILLDEPAGGMTPSETFEMAELINLHVAPGRTIVLIEHKMDLISKICNHLVVLNHGEKIVEGETHEVLSHKKVLEAYIGI